MLGSWSHRVGLVVVGAGLLAPGSATAAVGDINVEPTMLNFGNAFVGATQNQQVRVENTGDFTDFLQIDGHSISGSSDFSVTDNCGPYPRFLAGSESCLITVRFRPSSRGAKSGTLSISSNDENESPANVTLNGTGVGPAPVISPNSIDLSARAGQSSPTQELTITNAGDPGQNYSATVSLVDNSDPDGQFSLAFGGGGGRCASQPISIPAGGTCTIGVAFAADPAFDPASSDGAVSAAIRFNDNTPESPRLVPANGLATTAPQALITPLAIEFPPREVGSTSPPVVVTVDNRGSEQLMVDGVGITGSAAAEFAVSSAGTCGTPPFTLEFQQACSVSIVFTPAAAGLRSAELVLDDNSVTGTTSRAVSGTGLAPSEPDPTPAPAKADATIKRSTDRAALGDGVYIDAAEQTRKWSARPRQRRTFLVGLQNDGLGAGALTVAGCGKVAGFKVRYLAGAENVTPLVNAGTYATESLAPGASTELSLEMTPKKSAEPKSRGVCVTTAADAGAIDAVAASVKVKPAL